VQGSVPPLKHIGRISHMAIYPIKGCRRVEVESALVGRTGLEGDREYMIVREKPRHDGVHEFITQRHKRTREERGAQSLAILALIAPEVRGGALRLTWRGADPIAIDGDGSGDVMRVMIHDDTVLAVDQGEHPAAWLTEHLGLEVRLVRAAGPFHRLARQNFMRNSNEIAFQDAYPIHWIMQESVDELSEVVGQEIPWTRFRPNVVAEGGEPQVEHEIHEGRIGELRFVQPKPCTRCPVTTVDQEEGHKTGNEPLTSLSGYKKWVRTGEVIFGENLLPLDSGTVRVGDNIEELIARSPPLIYGRR
jgi:uncharacterized protein